MQFPDSYFEDEVREGFFVAGMMKRAWAAQLEVLSDIDQICKKHQITYFADFGTLLGAVRHQGFIPWDDDLDICMKREDYNRFLAVAKELPEGYFVRNIHTDVSYTELFTRVLNSREINFEAEFLEKFHGCPYGMGIDVFVMDNLAPNQKEEKRQMQMIHSVLQMMEEFHAGVPDERAWNMQRERIGRELSVRINSSRPLNNQMFLLLDAVFSLYTGQKAKELAVMPLWIKNKKCRMPKIWYRETVELPFETGTIPAPMFYDAVLYRKYRQYMASQKMGGTHDYPLYRKQEEALKRQVGINPYTYVISKEELKSNALSNCAAEAHPVGMFKKKDAPQKMTVKKQIRAFLQLMQDSQNNLDHIFSSDDLRGSEENTEKLLKILTGCQETAITFGTLIESVKGEGTDTVGRLEAYCEEVYRIYEAVSKDEGNVLCVNSDRLRMMTEEIEKTCKREMNLRHEVVFLPYRASDWDALESVWKAAREDPDCVVFVIPIPYFTKKADGSFGDMHYEGDRFPDYVPLTAYNAFDYEGHYPDVMYIQNPYDAYNLAVSVHPFFYSENLKKYTETLVYLPPFVVNELTKEDQRAIENLKYCCIVPGVVHADRVIVQSEGMRQIYIQILTEAAGEETREIWEEKILGLGSPKMDRNLEYDKEHMNLPKEWISRMRKPDGSLKKVVLYGTSMSALLKYQNAMLEKMERIFAVFEERQEEILLLWAADYTAARSMKDTQPVLWEEYQKRMQQYQEKDLGILDCSGDLKRAADVCDAYYGDRGYLAQLCIRRGVPVMLQEVEVR